MSETKSLAAPKASFDRRAVVKGAAWSVPVIAAAIAAPAAAASARNATLTFDAPVARTFTPNTADQADRTGQASPGFTLSNGSGDLTVISATLTIGPAKPVSGKDGVGVTTLTDVNTTNTFSGRFTGKTYTINFTHTPVVASNGSVSYTLSGFNYNGLTAGTGGDYTMTVTFNFSGGISLTASSTIKLT